MTSPEVSVIIPTYKHADFVLETLGSVFAQTFGDYEVIVVNDGSPDGTADLLRPLAQAGRIVYLEQPNAGQAAARNLGLTAARGRLIAFLDDDDLWLPDNLAVQTGQLRAAKPDVAACAGQCEFLGAVDSSRPPLVTDDTLTFPQLLRRNCLVSPGQTLVRKEALAAIGGFGAVRGGADDWDCWLRLARHGRIVAAAQVALRYRVHASNASLDAVAMLRSAREVITRHTRRSSPTERADAFAHLLTQASVFVAHQSVRALRRGNVEVISEASKHLAACLRQSGWSSRSLKTVLGAFAGALGSAASARLPRRNAANDL